MGLLDEPTGSASRSDELLAAGVAGLRFFDLFGPLYARYTAAPFDVEREIYGPYRRLAGMDLAALRRDSAAFQACGQSLAETTGVLRSSSMGLADRWRGHGASNTTDHVVAVLDVAGLLDEDISAVGRACGHLADALEEVVRSYASAALSLYSPTCATGSPALVESLIELTEYQAEPAPAAQRIARQILDEDFVPTFEERLRVFREEVVSRYEDDIRTTWSEFHEATSVEQVPENPFAGVCPVPPATAGPSATAGPPEFQSGPMHSQQPGDQAGDGADPVQPGTTQPGTTQSGTDADWRVEPDTVTIRQGASTITAQSPDGAGSMRITADDGSGRPQEHTVDFGPADAPGARASGAGTDQLGAARATPVVFQLGDVTVTAERIADGGGLLVTIDGGTGEVSRYLVDVHPVRGLTAHRVPDTDGIGAALGDGSVTTRTASLGRLGPSGADSIGGAVLGDAGPGGASLGSVADRERGDDSGAPAVRRELDGSGEYRERSGGGWHLPTELARAQDAREKPRNALAEERPTC
ncbi:MAG: hypothetical protein M3291_04930 [Actinomycetota bacterium]|nr:hypothetical protein [Actinomycetota bacterium]